MSAETPGDGGSPSMAARARGQSRSVQRKTVPEPLSMPAHSVDLSHDAVDTATSYMYSGNAQNQNGHAIPILSPGMSTARESQPPISAFPSHHDAGFASQASPSRKASLHGLPSVKSGLSAPSSHSVFQEITSGLLIPLPFVFLRTIWATSSRSTPDPVTIVDIDEDTSADPIASIEAPPPSTLLIVCLLTACTLICIGLFGEMRNLGWDAKSRIRRSSEKVLSLGTMRRLLGRPFSIGLPFYAATKLGEERVALVLLTCLGADLMSTTPKAELLMRTGDFYKTFQAHRFVLAIVAVQLFLDVAGFSKAVDGWSSTLGYVAIFTSILILPPPYLTTQPKASVMTSPISKKAQRSQMLTSPLDGQLVGAGEMPEVHSPLISTPWDGHLTLASGLLAALFAALVFFNQPGSPLMVSSKTYLGGFFVILMSTISFTMAAPRSLRSSGHFGALLGIVLVMISDLFSLSSIGEFATQSILAGLAWLAMGMDTHYQRSHSLFALTGPASQMRRPSHPREPHSKATGLLLRFFEDWPLVHSILVEKDSRRIFYFMILNFAFMLVQTFYGYVSKSLGLLSDSVHMFFDCVALLVGLAAAVMSKWPPDLRFPYGYGMIDTLAGFANGVFLMLISLEIVYEAVERLAEGVQIQRLTELLVVSTLGLLVNCVGMLAFGHAHHGHGHDHGHGHGHGHSHSHDHHHHHDHSSHSHHEHDSNHTHDHAHHEHSHDHSLDGHSLGSIEPHQSRSHSHPHDHSHSHSHVHGHSHANENMIGIWLHVLADTLGSAAVVVSTLLVHFTGWPGFDPLASCLIAILIFGSAVPLVTSTAKRLLLTVPEPTEFDIREAITGVCDLPGIIGVTIPRVWVSSGESGGVQGVMHVLVGRNTDIDEARAKTLEFLRQKGMDILVQVEREGDTRCWCGAATATRRGSFT